MLQKVKQDYFQTFFSKKEIIKLFKNFEIIDLSEVVTINHSSRKNEFATWNIICKKVDVSFELSFLSNFLNLFYY